MGGMNLAQRNLCQLEGRLSIQEASLHTKLLSRPNKNVFPELACIDTSYSQGVPIFRP